MERSNFWDVLFHIICARRSDTDQPLKKYPKNALNPKYTQTNLNKNEISFFFNSHYTQLAIKSIIVQIVTNWWNFSFKPTKIMVLRYFSNFLEVKSNTKPTEKPLLYTKSIKPVIPTDWTTKAECSESYLSWGPVKPFTPINRKIRFQHIWNFVSTYAHYIFQKIENSNFSLNDQILMGLKVVWVEYSPMVM